MPFVELAGALCRHFGWPPMFWRAALPGVRGMSWRLFRAYLREMNAQHEREQRTRRTDPGSWRGAEHDGWFAAQHAKARGGVA